MISKELMIKKKISRTILFHRKFRKFCIEIKLSFQTFTEKKSNFILKINLLFGMTKRKKKKKTRMYLKKKDF